MGPGAVAGVEVLAQAAHQVALTEDDQPIQTLGASSAAEHSLADGVGARRAEGVRTTSNPRARRAASKSSLNLRTRSLMTRVGWAYFGPSGGESNPSPAGLSVTQPGKRNPGRPPSRRSTIVWRTSGGGVSSIVRRASPKGTHCSSRSRWALRSSRTPPRSSPGRFK